MDEIPEAEGVYREQFGDSFLWGISTAAYQIEGSHDADGKGPSIWDVFTSTKGKIKDSHHGQIACDFYNCYERDIQHIKDLNIPNFRFSLSWSRLFPKGRGLVNQLGIDYYNKVIDYCLESDITPWVTLYHWDLPQALEEQGGWTNREVIEWFSEFTSFCARTFGDRVKNWIVMNEPSVFTGAGYFLGIHAPGKKGLKNFLPAIHHVTLATAASGKILKSMFPDSNIGTTFSCSYIEPHSGSRRDISAAIRVDALLNRTFIEPILGLGYPKNDLPILKKMDRYIKAGDLEAMAFDFDFIGIQNYTREIVRSSIFIPYIGANLVKAENRGVPLTEMKWEVYPPSIYHMIKKYDAYPQIKKILITENGAAFVDSMINGEVKDVRRKKYIQDNIAQVLKAKNEGARVEGYFIWTLTDNFEWAEGYHPRFGLIYVDFESQIRTIKDSGKWFAKFLGADQEELAASNEGIQARSTQC